jgi:signal transduction histidine kinase
MPAVALTPFSEGFEQGTVAYARTSLERHRDKGPHIDARLTLMDGMNADLVVPLRAGDLVLGWLALKDEPWSDGFSHEEVRRISATLSRAATVIENLKGFEALKEQSRLAALGTMSAGLAHEIRNPLAGIKGAAQYLQALDAEPEELEFLDVIVSETDRLNAVVSSFLDYARHFNLNREPCSLNDLVDQVLSLIHAEGLPAGVELSTSMDPDLPELPVDGLKLRQVFLNLLRNALQALPDGGRVHVSSYLGRMKSTGLPAVVVAVSDDGGGVPAQNLEKLFVPFYTTKVKGTGLGLPICQRIVRAHLGELNVESQPGAGATFYVRIPTPASGLADPAVEPAGGDLDPLP